LIGVTIHRDFKKLAIRSHANNRESVLSSLFILTGVEVGFWLCKLVMHGITDSGYCRPDACHEEPGDLGKLVCSPLKPANHSSAKEEYDYPNDPRIGNYVGHAASIFLLS
jgi:hypothetical protein